MTHDEIMKRFTYHAPTQGQPELYESIRHVATDMAKDIERTTGTACGYIRDGRVAPNGHTYRYMTAEEIKGLKTGD